VVLAGHSPGGYLAPRADPRKREPHPYGLSTCCRGVGRHATTPLAASQAGAPTHRLGRGASGERREPDPRLMVEVGSKRFDAKGKAAKVQRLANSRSLETHRLRASICHLLRGQAADHF
jgi:hypothetical protein